MGERVDKVRGVIRGFVQPSGLGTGDDGGHDASIVCSKLRVRDRRKG